MKKANLITIDRMPICICNDSELTTILVENIKKGLSIASAVQDVVVEIKELPFYENKIKEGDVIICQEQTR